MKDWIKHIKKDDNKTYCGLDSSGLWLFQNLEHAELAILQEQCNLPCKKCLKAAKGVEISVVKMRQGCTHYDHKTNLCKFLKVNRDESGYITKGVGDGVLYPAPCDLNAKSSCIGYLGKEDEESEFTVILAGNERQFRQWCKDNGKRQYEKDIVNASSREKIEGLKNVKKCIRVGTWYHIKDYYEIRDFITDRYGVFAEGE